MESRDALLSARIWHGDLRARYEEQRKRKYFD
jgi:hypothetical protein